MNPGLDRPTFILKIRSLRGDGIHELRALLKRLLRPHQWRCVSVERGRETTAETTAPIKPHQV
jgi:hypothetical protein